MLDAFGLGALRLLQGLLLFGLCPISQHLAAEFPQLFNGHRFGFIGGGAISNGLVHLVSYFLQSPVSMRPIDESFVQCFGRTSGTSPAMIFGHYNDAMTPEQGRAWFNVVPEQPGNVIQAWEGGNEVRPKKPLRIDSCEWTGGEEEFVAAELKKRSRLG